MSRPGLAAAIATMTLIGAYQASAADLGTSIRNSERIDAGPRSYKVIRHARRHVVIVSRHRHFAVWKRVGMPCLLPPDVIVRYNWNGPQCRWVDNM
jgi:hypothetical protein